MKSIAVGLNERSYKIFFGKGVLGKMGSLCRELQLGNRAAVVTNPTVGIHYYEPVRSSLAASGFTVHKIEIPDGEEYKNSKTLETIYGRLIDFGLDRASFLVALGGGVVGDITGYAAATYLRGVPFVQIPTTLLAQVDSSVGGKTGINHEKGKNLIGTFYQPRCVLIDVATLDTLPEREYLSGMAEVVKYGIVLDTQLFNFISDNADELLACDKLRLLEVIKNSCAIKASVVEKDELETGLRAVLNYGHTLGHAVETLSGYKEFKHGEAVSIGMAQAAKISEAMGFADKADTKRILTLLTSLKLPVELPAFGRDAYVEALMRDKKVRDGSIHFVLNKGIGAFHIIRVTEISQLLEICGIGD